MKNGWQYRQSYYTAMKNVHRSQSVLQVFQSNIVVQLKKLTNWRQHMQANSE